MRHSIFFLAAAIGLAAIAVGGCSSQSSERPESTAMDRQEVPRQAVDQLLRAEQAYRQGAHAAALALTDSVERIVEDLPDLHFLRGQIYSALRQYDRAEQSYRRVLSLDSDYQGAWLNLGINAFRQSNIQTALNRYRNELDRHPTAEVWVEMGRAYRQLNKGDSARYGYEQALALDSTKAAAYMRLGQLYEQRGELEKAVATSRKGLAADTSNANYRYLLGSQLLQSGRAREAVDHLRTAVRERPWDAGAHQSLGQALTLAGREKEGQKYLLEVDSLEKAQSRIDNLRSLAQTHPNQPTRWVRLGDALRRSGRLGKAKEAYGVALSLAPNNVALRNNLANLAADLGRTREAIIRYRALLRQDSTLADVWLNLGVVYANAGRYEEARHAWQQVLEYRPNDPTARKYIARLDE